ncbi:MAG TPA: endonuclease/exonuclease/phosphatase family protein [Solirubrobacterales bacterium]
MLGARRHRLIWIAVASLAGWAIVRLPGLDGVTPLAPLMAFTPWVAGGSLLVLGVALASRNWAAGLVTGLAAAVLGLALLPRVVGAGEDVPEDAQTLTVLSANVYRGNADPDALVDLVERIDPDVLAVQELDPAFDRALQEAGIGALLPRKVVLLKLPSLPDPPNKQKRRPGIGVYSDLGLRPLPRRATTASSRLAVRLPSGDEIRLVNFHPLTPSLAYVDRWGETLRSLPSAGGDDPWLLVGDFNATLDQAEMRDVLDRGYRDAAETTGNGLEMTWPTVGLTPPLVAIDHVLADRRLGIAGFGVEDLPGSDHKAVWSRVFVRPGQTAH